MFGRIEDELGTPKTSASIKLLTERLPPIDPYLLGPYYLHPWRPFDGAQAVAFGDRHVGEIDFATIEERILKTMHMHTSNNVDVVENKQLMMYSMGGDYLHGEPHSEWSKIPYTINVAAINAFAELGTKLHQEIERQIDITKRSVYGRKHISDRPCTSVSICLPGLSGKCVACGDEE